MSLLRSRIGASKGLRAIVTSAFLALNACGSSSLRPVTCSELPIERRPVEICNGADENCNGSVDEGCDNDGDGFCGSKELVYNKGGPYLLDTCAKTFEGCDEFKCGPVIDCDDSNQAVNPSATEYCNGIDDNCDMSVDEYYPEIEDPVCGSLDSHLDGMGECKVGLYDCVSGSLVCSGDVLPHVEACNGLDDDCDSFIDNKEASLEFRLCFYDNKFEDGSWVKVEPCPGWNPDSDVSCPTMYHGICSPGVERCSRTCLPSMPDYESCVVGKVGGDNVCYGVILPEVESCDGLDNDCNDIYDDGFDVDGDSYVSCMGDCDDGNPLVNPGIEEIACDGFDNNCDGEELPWTDGDNDLYSPDGGLCGPVDCDDRNPLVNPGMAELCDCLDNNCDSIIDNGLRASLTDVVVATDCSGSMIDKINAVVSYFSSAAMLACFSDEVVNVSNVIIDRPAYIARSLVTMEEFQDNYASDVPSDGSCSWAEPSLNVVAYAACLVPGMDSDPICQSISSYNSFIGTQLWRQGSIKHFVLVSDEKAQWYSPLSSPEVYNQQQIAQLAADAGMIVDVYTLPLFFNLDNTDPQGYGYFSTLTGGNLYDLGREIYNGTLGVTFNNAIISWYCK